MTTWKNSLQKTLWIPIMLTLLFLGAFLYDSSHSGFGSRLSLMYFLSYMAAMIIYWIPNIMAEKYPVASTHVVLLLITVILFLGSLKNNFVGDAIRSFIEKSLDLNYFLDALTVFALWLAIADIQNRETKKISSIINGKPKQITKSKRKITLKKR